MRDRYPLKKVKQEVNSCIDTWKTIFETRFSGRIEYAYAKGSGIKDWDSPIDCVPVLSDIDIHVKLRGDSIFSGPKSATEEALKTSREYEELFLGENPDHFHVSRTQIVVLNDAMKSPEFLLPLESSGVYVMMGEPELRKTPEKERIRAIDLENLMEIEHVLCRLPMSSIDKSGLDFWYLIRRLVWHVSPAPVRLLTQVVKEPEEVWEWNRTMVCEKLEEQGFPEVSQRYREYYLLGWEMYFTDFRDAQVMRDTISKACEVLESSLHHAKRVKSL